MVTQQKKKTGQLSCLQTTRSTVGPYRSQPHLSWITHKEQCKLYRAPLLLQGGGGSLGKITNRNVCPLCFFEMF